MFSSIQTVFQTTERSFVREEHFKDYLRWSTKLDFWVSLTVTIDTCYATWKNLSGLETLFHQETAKPLYLRKKKPDIKINEEKHIALLSIREQEFVSVRCNYINVIIEKNSETFLEIIVDHSFGNTNQWFD